MMRQAGLAYLYDDIEFRLLVIDDGSDLPHRPGHGVNVEVVEEGGGWACDEAVLNRGLECIPIHGQDPFRTNIQNSWQHTSRNLKAQKVFLIIEINISCENL